ncbi:MAG: ABC transporter permease [Spirochaetales bacterium]|nr:ABC transporter permease [Spirochaetales bacterium]
MKPFTQRFNIFFILGIVSILLVWKLVSLGMHSGILLPSPEAVFLVFLKKLPTRGFWVSVAVTSLRVTEGFLLSLVSGFVIGILCGKSRWFHAFSKPFISIVRVVPVLAIILLAVIWFRSDQVPVFVSFLMAFPVITGTIIEGMNSLDPKLDEMAAVYGLEKKDKLLHITIPQLFPFIVAGVRTSLGLSWKVVIAAEILSLPHSGIGTSMQYAQLTIETADVFSWTIAAVLVSALFELGVRLILSAFDWRRKSGQTD